MEEEKQRNKFYSAWSKGIVIALFLTAVACFSVFAMIFGGLMCQGFRLGRVDKQLLQREKLSGDSGLWTADGFTGK